MPVKTCDLSRCFLCSHSSPEWKELIQLKKTTRRYRKGQTIIEEGTERKGIYFLYSGVVKVTKQWGREKELILRFARTGDVIGYRGLADAPQYPVSAVAVTEAELCFVPTGFLETLLLTNAPFTYALLRVYAAELHGAEKRMRDLAHRDVKGRIAQALQEFISLFGLTDENKVPIPISRQDIASYAGTTYETVFRFLAELNQAGILTTSGKEIQVLQPEGLQPYIRVAS